MRSSVEGGRDLHLTEEELDTAEIEIIGGNEPKSHPSILIGSLKSSRPFNAFALHSTLKGVRKGFNFREISTNLFSFQFNEEAEKSRCLNSGP